MNTNPSAKTILCYGDSNTNGQRPDGGRYASDVRWTGQLQKLLGDDYYVIEEGLGGRTTNLDHPTEDKPGRNGYTYFVACVQSHTPLDVIIVMLGTNDLKNVYHRSAEETAGVLSDYCDVIRSHAPTTKVVLVSPAPIIPVEPIGYYDQEAADKSRQLASELQRVAEREDATFYDAADVVELGDDGLHWHESCLASFAMAMESRIRGVL